MDIIDIIIINMFSFINYEHYKYIRVGQLPIPIRQRETMT